MSGVRWVNQKIGNFFGDFKADRELAVEPGDVCRGITRLVCLVCLLSGFGVAFYRLFTEAPNVAVQRVYLQQKNANFSITRLYDETVAYGTDIDAANITNSSVISADSQEVLDCPCTTTTISWTTFVHFYVINYSALVNNVTVMNYVVVNDSLTMDSGSTADDFDEKYISRDTVDLTNETFCASISILPSKFMFMLRDQLDCPAMVTGLLTTNPQKNEVPGGADSQVGGSNWNDPRASYFESPSLLNQKFLYSNTIRRLRAYLREQYTLLNTIRPLIGDNLTNREMFFKGMTELWLMAVDRFGANSSSTDLQFFVTAFARVHATFYELGRFYPEPFAVVLYDGNATFLGMDINWTEYYRECKPDFCDVTRKTTGFYRAYTVLALLGGLWSLAVVVVTLIVWPVIVILLVHSVGFCCNVKASSQALSRAPSAYRKLERPKSTDEL